MTSRALELNAVTKRYGATTALADVELTVAPGRVHALMGENGAGKSTLLKILSGAIRPDSGRMSIAGRPVDLHRFSTAQARARGIAIVHQEFSLVPSMTVAENIFLGRELRNGPLLARRSMTDAAAGLLARVRCRADPDARVSTLGVADAQLVEIAKALAGDALFMALDEPSAVLSGTELTTLFEIIRSLTQEGVGILYVSHRMGEVFSLCDDYTVLKDGVVSGTGQVADSDADALINLMVGRTVSQELRGSVSEPGPVRLAARGLQVEGLPDPVDFELRQGEIVGLAGLQGAGRSRLGRALFGDIRSHGLIEIDGVARKPFARPAEAMSAGVAYLPEDRKTMGLALSKSVAMNGLMLSWRHLRSRWRWISGPRETERINEMIASLSIKTALGGRDTTGSLSGGNQQKVVIGKWLELRPRIAIFDEPTRGIDVGAKEQIYQIIRSLADDGVAVLLISSELIEVLGLSDRILVMADGRIAGTLGGPSATEEQIMHVIAKGAKVAA